MAKKKSPLDIEIEKLEQERLVIDMALTRLRAAKQAQPMRARKAKAIPELPAERMVTRG
jgi:hypothetical protein